MTDVATLAGRARQAARALAVLPPERKSSALQAIAAALVDAAPDIVAANAQDVAAAVRKGTPAALVDRLTLDESRVRAAADGARQVATLADPVGEVVRDITRPDGLRITQRRVPFGVIGIVYEARPNVTVDAAALCLRSGNAVLLRGSSSAETTNRALVDVMRGALESDGVPADAVQLVPAGDRGTVKELLHARGLVDLVIPRGGADLIRLVVDEATVPVIETGVGNCHVYVDEDADLEQALAIALNAKTSRPSVCNAAETILVHSALTEDFLPRLLDELRAAGVTVHGDATTAAAGGDVVPATDEDWAAEYLSLDVAVRVVDSFDVAVDHIRRWGSGHTEAIVTRSPDTAKAFVDALDAAVVAVNASTRFTDGEQFGFGAEIGISTQKSHARGPMGLTELTTTSYVVTGDGHIRT
jgi:glutamate-5-semialdehyde dehydrogenase